MTNVELEKELKELRESVATMTKELSAREAEISKGVSKMQELEVQISALKEKFGGSRVESGAAARCAAQEATKVTTRNFEQRLANSGLPEDHRSRLMEQMK